MDRHCSSPPRGIQKSNRTMRRSLETWSPGNRGVARSSGWEGEGDGVAAAAPAGEAAEAHLVVGELGEAPLGDQLGHLHAERRTPHQLAGGRVARVLLGL